MGKVKSITAGECEVCGGETDIDSPKVCYGCAMTQLGFQVKIDYRLIGSDREAQDLAVKGVSGMPIYRWTVLTGLCESVTGEARSLAEADADARVAVEEACRAKSVTTNEPVPF